MVEETSALIFNELDNENKVYWFDLKQKKFLHQIDTFYYSVKLLNDFTKDTTDKSCLHLRKYFIEMYNNFNSFDSEYPFVIKDLDVQLNYVPSGHFADYYKIRLKCPDMFDIFIADMVPEGQDGDSVTPEIIVQLRSELLWQYGPTKAFEYSYKTVETICRYFNLLISEVKENRADYCWHSNYLQSPEKFFNIEKFVKMQVSHFRRVTYQYQFRPNDEYENDYIALGKRSDKVFVRIYLKSKEVVEKGYKGWFLKEWLFNGLINRFDFYVYEKCYTLRSWKYLDKARLEWYLEYGESEYYKREIWNILDETSSPSDETIMKLADQLTPRTTLITNVEFQTTRKMSKTFKELFPLKYTEDKGVCKRIYDYLGNHALITEYITRSVLRLVDRNTDSNKSRCDYCGFWKALRSTKFVDVKKPRKELKLIRDYSRNLDANVVKKRALSAAVSFSLYKKGINSNSSLQDAADFLCCLNDNDIEMMDRLKNKRIKQLNKYLYEDPAAAPEQRNYLLCNKETGEIT